MEIESLVGVPVKSITTEEDNQHILYIGCHHAEISQLPSGSEVSLVYEARNGIGWHVVRFKKMSVVFTVINRRNLEPDEVTYFEQILRQTFV
ncbi:MAG: hypothetical protein J0L63_15440 [Anaerolineae bacterium]|nr:hypothetical protein [Anaerolineae bacterium]MBN8620303.1 hypothetical protein [Anaerolineae bacterium]